MRSVFAVLLLAVLLLGFARADSQPPSLRKLCIDSPTIVLAAPVDPISPTRFTIVEVLRGKGVARGTILAPAGLQPGEVQTFDEVDPETKKPRPRRISQALLFLTGDPSPRVILAGLRMCCEDGRVLAPVGEKGKLEVRPQLRWPVLIARMRLDVAAIDRVQGYRGLARPQRRTQALLDWVARNRGAFAAAPVPGLADENPAGWEDLQIKVFDWVLESGRPADGWAAVKLYAEINRGEVPQLRFPTFSTPEGRALLMKIALDKTALTNERERALLLLGERITLWPTATECGRGARAMPVAEQEALLDQLAGLLATKDETLVATVVRTIARLSKPEVTTLTARRTTRVLPALMTAYKNSRLGVARDELATAIFAQASASQWKALTGNPAGICACLRDMERKDSTVSFWLAMQLGGRTVYEAPVLVLEKLGTLGFVSETQRLSLRVMNLDRAWQDGWTGPEMLAVHQDLPTLTPGTIYRLRVEGFAGKGKDRQKWQSEPKRFHVPLPKQPTPGGRRGRYYRGIK